MSNITPKKIADILSKSIPSELHPNINCCVLGAAAHGNLEEHDSQTYEALDQNFSLNVIKFEPDKSNYELEKSRRRDYETWINRGIADGNPHDFFITNYEACSSIFEPDLDKMNQFNCGKLSSLMQPKAKFTIQTSTLDDAISLPIDDLRMDIQGAELMALEGAETTLKTVLTVQTEVSFVQQYKNQPLFTDIEFLLRKRDFNLTRLMEPHHHPLTPFTSENPSDNAFIPLWTDALFVKNVLNPSRLDPEMLLKLAILSGVRYQMLDVMYRSIKTAVPNYPTLPDLIMSEIFA